MPSGRNYFRAFREAVLAARQEVILLAWDLCETVEMIRDEADDDGYPSKLVDFIMAVLDEKPELHIKILLWDYAVIYVAERDWLPFTKLGRLEHPRFELVTDDTVPAGASHHQKLAIFDGSLAMCGGLDLAAWRWDSPEHSAEDPRRLSPKNKPYGPYHDIQLSLTGEVVKTLRELASSRWERATGHPLPEFEASKEAEIWPESVSVDFESVEVAIALTYPKYKAFPEARQIEQLYLDCIQSAEASIYIENQYLTSKVIVDALCRRLEEEDGPEVVMLLTREAGWAEDITMGRMRNRLLEKLRAADSHGRFRCYYPCIKSEAKEQQIYVHAKLMIVDQRLFVFGSANLSNRSMRVDSELNLGFVEKGPKSYLESLQARLLAIHLHKDESEIKETLRSTGSLLQTIEKLNSTRGNRLNPLDASCKSDLERQLADSQLLDPDEPISPIHNVWGALKAQSDLYWQDKNSSPYLKAFKILSWLVAFIVTGLVIAQLWRSGFSQEQATSMLAALKDTPGMIPLVILIFVVGGIIAVPINLLVIATALTLGSWAAIGCGLAGSLLAAAASFGLGHHFGKPLVRRIIGERLDTIINSLRGRGIGSMIVLRLLPIAPFGLINLVAGVSGLRFRVFMIGSAIGMLPGLVAVVLATNHFQRAIENPNPRTWLVFLLLAGLILGSVLWAKKKFT
ncbi:MAG TPA: VTT domain-containing protein [Opitutales bacterium]|nr:VTT domain-containing protein [Opitutales bacterium]